MSDLPTFEQAERWAENPYAEEYEEVLRNNALVHAVLAQSKRLDLTTEQMLKGMVVVLAKANAAMVEELKSKAWNAIAAP